MLAMEMLSVFASFPHSFAMLGKVLAIEILSLFGLFPPLGMLAKVGNGDVAAICVEVSNEVMKSTKDCPTIIEFRSTFSEKVCPNMMVFRHQVFWFYSTVN